MKKILIVTFSILSCILLVGCTNTKSGTLNCTKTSTDEDGYKTEEILKATYENNKVIKVEEISIEETDPNFINFSYAILSGIFEKLKNVDGINVDYSKIDNNKIKSVMKIDYSKFKIESLKEALGELYSDDSDTIYKKANVNITDLKQEYEKDGYTCN